MSEHLHLFWPASAPRGDTVAVLPCLPDDRGSKALYPLIAAASRESFCLIRPEDAWRFFDSLGQTRIVTHNAAQLCNLIMATVSADTLRQAIRRHFFHLALDGQLIDLRLLDGLLRLATRTQPEQEKSNAMHDAAQKCMDRIALDPDELRSQLHKVLEQLTHLESRTSAIAGWPSRSSSRHAAFLGSAFQVGCSLALHCRSITLSLDRERIAAVHERWEVEAQRLQRRLAEGPLASGFQCAEGIVAIDKKGYVLKTGRLRKALHKRALLDVNNQPVDTRDNTDNGDPTYVNNWLELKPFDEEIAAWIDLETVAQLLRLARCSDESPVYLASELPRLTPKWNWDVWERLISEKLLRPSVGRAFIIELPELRWRCFAEFEFTEPRTKRLRECYAQSRSPLAEIAVAIESYPGFPRGWRNSDRTRLAGAILDCLCLGVQEHDVFRHCNSLGPTVLGARVIKDLVQLVIQIFPELSPTLERQVRSTESKFRRRACVRWCPSMAGHLDLADDFRKAMWTKLGANGFELLAASPEKSLIARPMATDSDEHLIRNIAAQAAKELLTTSLEVNVIPYS